MEQNAELPLMPNVTVVQLEHSKGTGRDPDHREAADIAQLVRFRHHWARFLAQHASPVTADPIPQCWDLLPAVIVFPALPQTSS